MHPGQRVRLCRPRQAVGNFFTDKNLASLREIALRRTADRLNDLAPDLDIYIIPDQKANQTPHHAREQGRTQEQFSATDVLKMLGVLTLCTLGGCGFAFLGFSDPNIIMPYLLGVLVISMVTAGRATV